LTFLIGLTINPEKSHIFAVFTYHTRFLEGLSTSLVWSSAGKGGGNNTSGTFLMRDQAEIKEIHPKAEIKVVPTKMGWHFPQRVLTTK
jgi:hypothetical protein